MVNDMFYLTLIGAIIMLIFAGVGIIALAYMCAFLPMILPFNEDYKETEAEVIDFTVVMDSGGDYYGSPILRYYNIYKGEIVTKEFINSGIPYVKANTPRRQYANAVDIGDKVTIEYTKHFQRVQDKRFTSEKKYKLSRYLVPVIICFSCSAVGFILLIVGIVLGK